MKAGLGWATGLAVLAAGLGCTGPGSVSTQTTAAPTASPAPASPSTPPSTPVSPTPSPPAPDPGTPVADAGATCHLEGPRPTALVIGKVAGSSATVVRDVSNPSAGRDICTLSPGGSWQFAGENRVSLAQPDRGRIIVAELSSGRAGRVAEWVGAGFASGAHAWSPDGSSLAYLVSDPSGLHWHLLRGGTDRVIADLPPIPSRGVSNIQDDVFLEFAPDGRHVALVETFATGGSGEKAPVQVRSADGALVYSAASGRMGVWTSQPSRLYFRSLDGQVTRWDPTEGAAVVASGIIWVRPRASRDGASIAYSSGGAAEIPDFHLYSVPGNAVSPLGHAARAEPRFIGPGLIWYVAAVPCQCPLAYLPGDPYVYEVTSGSESATRLLSLDDVWQR